MKEMRTDQLLAGHLASMKRELEGDILVRPGVDEKRSGSRHGFEIERLHGVLQLPNKVAQPLLIDVNLAALSALYLYSVVVRDRSIQRNILELGDARGERFCRALPSLL